MKYTKFLLNPLPVYATQIINAFLSSRISAIHDKVQGLSANNEILIKGVVSLLNNLFYNNIFIRKMICFRKT